jgi:hypothetical protein
MHLRLHPLLEQELALFQQLGVNMGPQIPRLRIYSLIFLFDPDIESGFHDSRCPQKRIQVLHPLKDGYLSLNSIATGWPKI